MMLKGAIPVTQMHCKATQMHSNPCKTQTHTQTDQHVYPHTEGDTEKERERERERERRNKELVTNLTSFSRLLVMMLDLGGAGGPIQRTHYLVRIRYNPG